jgi:ribosomal protein S18 acetylase RimI-like enzyme
VAATASRQSSDSSYGIQYIAVHPSRQGRGLGKQLLLASEELARQHGCTEIHLSVYLDNIGAIAFYERMGWQKYVEDEAWRGLMFKRLTQADAVEILPVAVNPLATAASL